ncbi:MAG: protein-L-isoaspartate(D-aspartate) O-methyltransferase [Acidobacteriales bacterium]|nr:protein-L-isoaspartate(D-aspartate) O-methyltransferase [Terriglobales bacterium]
MVQRQLRSRGIRDERVLAAMERVPRHEFVPAAREAEAYSDHPVNIGEGQTISQPYMVASMLEAARIQPADVVLEIGTGSGYQTALLAELAAEVFSMERFASLADAAQRRLAHLNYANVVIVVSDGSQGLPGAAPFDAIVVAAAAPAVPMALVDQLRDNGRLVVPVGGLDEQVLHQVWKHGDESVDRALYACRFVPLIGRYGFPSDPTWN